jgi:CheY-like chemotaxis protein
MVTSEDGFFCREPARLLKIQGHSFSAVTGTGRNHNMPDLWDLTLPAGGRMEQTSGEPADVLVIDDDAGDALLIQESLAASGSVRCHTVSRHSEARGFLRRTGQFADAPRPWLILLDLNLGDSHGLDVLAEVKGDAELMSIPVVVLSSSRHPADIDTSYALHANAYVVKPIDLDDMTRAVQTIEACFITLMERAHGRCRSTGHHPVAGDIDISGTHEEQP